MKIRQALWVTVTAKWLWSCIWWQPNLSLKQKRKRKKPAYLNCLFVALQALLFSFGKKCFILMIHIFLMFQLYSVFSTHRALIVTVTCKLFQCSFLPFKGNFSCLPFNSNITTMHKLQHDGKKWCSVTSSLCTCSHTRHKHDFLSLHIQSHRDKHDFVFVSAWSLCLPIRNRNYTTVRKDKWLHMNLTWTLNKTPHFYSQISHYIKSMDCFAPLNN